MTGVSRRGLLGGMLGAVGLVACGGAPKKQPLVIPPVRVDDLAGVLPRAGLRWLVRARPAAVTAISWLGPAIARVIPDERVDALRELLGFDARKATEVIGAGYAGAARAEEESVWLVRHDAEPSAVERAFRERLVSEITRSELDVGLVRLSGKVGLGRRTLYVLGRDVACYQYGGDEKRGPARVASLYAQGKIKRSPTVFADGPLLALAKRFGDAPVTAFVPGPFEGDVAKGVHGLGSVAVALGAAARATARDRIGVAIALVGDFSSGGVEAEKALGRAWTDLGAEDVGKRLGLDAPLSPVLLTHGADAVALSVELDATRLSKGLDAIAKAKIELAR